MTKGFEWDDENGGTDPVLEAHWDPIIAQMDRETDKAGKTFDSAMTELPKAIMIWEWFSKMKNENIPKLLELWKVYAEAYEQLHKVRLWTHERDYLSMRAPQNSSIILSSGSDERKSDGGRVNIWTKRIGQIFGVTSQNRRTTSDTGDRMGNRFGCSGSQ
jgi:hypothetical protein